MRRVLAMISVLILVSLACQTLLPSPTPTLPPVPTSTLAPTVTASPTPSPSQTPLPSPEATSTLELISDLPEADEFLVRYHPDDGLYAGDLVSIEVIAPTGAQLPEAQLTVQVNPPEGSVLGTMPFENWGIAGRDQATLTWAWDTHGLSAGSYNLHYSIAPQDIQWTETVFLQPAERLPAYLAHSTWETHQSDCCTIHLMTQTASERDAQSLISVIEEQAQRAAGQMQADFDEKVNITLLPRLLGHGGFASSEVHVSVLDRNYAANDWDMVIHHEMIHILDGRLGGDLRPTLFIEGAAVYLSGGHYKPEPLMQRAAALLPNRLGWYLPLIPLSDNFYASQHEISYLQAGALVEYMVEQYGWEAFEAYYRDIHPSAGGKESEAIDEALLRHFGISFAQLESDFIAALQALPDVPEWAADVRITVSLFDTLRRYQELLDSSAYFATAWLLDSQQMRQRGIVADYLRHPIAAENLALETMLVAAGEDLDQAPYPQAERLLQAVNAVMDAIEQGDPAPFQVNTLAADYAAIVDVVQAAGYEPQKIIVDGDLASAQAGQGNEPLTTLTLERRNGLWFLND